MTDEAEDPDRPNNLWEPVAGDHGAHGRFDDRARERSIELELNLNRSKVGPFIAIAIGSLAGALREQRDPKVRHERERNAAKLSEQLRRRSNGHLRRRRAVVALSLAASASMALIALYQMGIIKHLSEPPLRIMNADKVDASAEAYEKFNVPDAVLGFGSDAATMGLAAMGGADRVKNAPWIPLALAAKAAFDVANAAKLSVDQWTNTARSASGV
jgi:hypothetical protein